MKLEDLPKYYSPKSPGLTDASASTSKDALSITDVMAAQGMTQNRAEMGFSAFLGKMGISMNGEKFIESIVFTNKVQYPDGKPPVWAKCTKGVYPSYWEEWKKVREVVKVACPECGGKGEVSTACKDCRGRGVAIHREESVKRGMPVIRDCQRCGGRGCERLPSTEAFNAICKVTSAITLDTWKKSVKRFYDTLVVRFDIEEAWAERQLKRVTR